MLRGERVTLRAVEREDLERLAGFANDLEVELAGGGNPPMPRTLDRLQRDFEREVSDPPRDRTNFAIEADGECIGTCGLFNIDWTARHAELGIGIGDKDYWGRGYGREAVGLLLDYAFRLRNLRRVWLEVHAGNERGIRAYRSCGFVEEGRMREHVWLAGRYVDNVIMGVLREEWNGEEGAGG
ncbi:MAG TPA: GNAT family protein [Rubrobacter sp.]|nr:GNAT family protein [Rubrobacter sp.]